MYSVSGLQLMEIQCKMLLIYMGAIFGRIILENMKTWKYPIHIQQHAQTCMHRHACTFPVSAFWNNLSHWWKKSYIFKNEYRQNNFLNSWKVPLLKNAYLYLCRHMCSLALHPCIRFHTDTQTYIHIHMHTCIHDVMQCM